MKANDGETTLKLRERLGIKVFVTTSKYDAAIANYLNKEQETTCSFSISMPCVARLRYGENPHQTARAVREFRRAFQKLHGKELSYNNILDITAASELIEEFSRTASCDSQAHQPVRRRFRSGSSGGVGQGVCHGQAGAVRRDHYHQSATLESTSPGRLARSSPRSSLPPSSTPKPVRSCRRRRICGS